MQGILISLATAAILAIGGAFAAPFLVDWTLWRGTFETEIARAIGVPVVIRGGIEAEILPAPRVVLKDVAIGDIVSSGGTTRELRAELSLGSLMRGEVQASSLTLVRPELRLVMDSTGRISAPPGAGAPADLAIAQFTVIGGALEILDRAADRRLRLEGLEIKGEARSLSGPFRAEGEATSSGQRYGVRATLGKFGDDGSGRLRLVLDRRGTPFSADLDGALRFTDGLPRFEGRGTLQHKASKPGTLDAWNLSATLRAAPDAVVASALDLSLGDEARPVQLSGSARLSLVRNVALDVVLNARSVDLDALRPPTDASQQTPIGAITGLATTFTALPVPDIKSRIGVAVEQLTLGGTVVRDARADLSGTPTGWRIDTAEATLPGRAALRLSGVPARSTEGATFAGDLSFSAEDPVTFLRWAAPKSAPDYIAAVEAPVRIAGRLSAGPARIAVDGLDAAFGSAVIKGSAAAALSAKDGPQLDLKLAMEGVNLDPLIAAMKQAATAVGGGADATLSLTGRNLTLAGLPMRGLTLEGTATGGNWRVPRLVAEDLAGLRLEGSGQMENFSTRPRGSLTASVSGTRADGLVPLAELAAGPRAAAVMQRLVPVAAPVKLSTEASWGENGGRSLTTRGQLGQISGTVTFARTTGDVPLRVEMTADAADGARALEALGFSGLRTGIGPGRLEFAADPVADGQSQVRGRLALAGSSAMGQGTVQLMPDGSYEPRLTLHLESGDLARLSPLLAAANDGAPVPAVLNFSLARTGGIWALDQIQGSAAGAPLSGALTLESGAVPRLGGRLAFDSLSVPRILSVWAAHTVGPDGSAPWSAARLAPGPMTGLALNLDLSAGSMAVLGPYVVENARLRLVGEAGDLEVRDASGTFGKGRFFGNLGVRRRGDGLQADGRLVLDGVDGAALLAPLPARTPPRGLASLTLDFGASGRSVLAMVQSLSGQGTLSVRDLRIEAADPTALDAVLAETATGTPPDERRTALMLEKALARGPMRVDSLETTIGVVNGVARLSPARVALSPARIALGGSFDLPRLAMDLTLDLEGNEVSGGLPGGTISWRGPVGAPERRVTATALTSVIAMRAIERETRRLEERQQAAPAPSSFQQPPPVTTPAPAAAPAALTPAAPAVTRPASEPANAGFGTGTGGVPAQTSTPPARGSDTGGAAAPVSAPAAVATPPRVEPAQPPQAARPATPPPLAPPRQIDRPQVQEAPRRVVPQRPDGELPPTPGFGNLPRPPARVGEGIY